MFGPKQCLRGKSTFPLAQRVYPELESLGNREAPSALAASRLLGGSLEEPFAVFRDWQANAENDAPLSARVRVAEADNQAADRDFVRGSPLGLPGPTWSLSLAPSITELGRAADPAKPTAGRLDLLKAAPAVTTDLPALADPVNLRTPLTLANRSSGRDNLQISPPVITDFHASEGCDGVWEFSGHVDSPIMPVTINLGSTPDDSLPELQGQTVDTDSGDFSWSTQLAPGEQGIATAQATNPDGQTSSVAETPVQPTGCNRPRG